MQRGVPTRYAAVAVTRPESLDVVCHRSCSAASRMEEIQLPQELEGRDSLQVVRGYEAREVKLQIEAGDVEGVGAVEDVSAFGVAVQSR